MSKKAPVKKKGEHDGAMRALSDLTFRRRLALWNAAEQAFPNCDTESMSDAVAKIFAMATFNSMMANLNEQCAINMQLRRDWNFRRIKNLITDARLTGQLFSAVERDVMPLPEMLIEVNHRCAASTSDRNLAPGIWSQWLEDGCILKRGDGSAEFRVVGYRYTTRYVKSMSWGEAMQLPGSMVRKQK